MNFFPSQYLDEIAKKYRGREGRDEWGPGDLSSVHNLYSSPEKNLSNSSSTRSIVTLLSGLDEKNPCNILYI